jgi:hypothetical protein
MAAIANAGKPLEGDSITLACDLLGVGPAEIWAVIQIETDDPHCGCLADRRPQILYEQHIFFRITNGNVTDPSISNSSPGNYGAAGAHQYSRLAAAIAVDRGAALKSTSWGLGQTLGVGFSAAGFASIDDLVTQMYASEGAQLQAMCQEITNDDLAAYLRLHDWPNFARGYNGSDYKRNNYDQRLAGAYTFFSNGNLPDLTLRAAQVYLFYLGFDPHGVDGVLGNRTRSALNLYRTSKGMPSQEGLDDQTLLALQGDFASLPVIDSP